MSPNELKIWDSFDFCSVTNETTFFLRVASDADDLDALGSIYFIFIEAGQKYRKIAILKTVRWLGLRIQVHMRHRCWCRPLRGGYQSDLAPHILQCAHSIAVNVVINILKVAPMVGHEVVGSSPARGRE